MSQVGPLTTHQLSPILCEAYTPDLLVYIVHIIGM